MRYFLLLVFSFLPYLAVAQFTPCATDEMTERLKEERPEYAAARAAFEERLQQMSPVERRAADPMVIPVVFHIIHQYGSENVSKAIIESAVERLNIDFQRLNTDTSVIYPAFKSRVADMNLEFRLARKAPDGSCTEGIVRVASPLTDEGNNEDFKQLSRWDPQRYMNVWIVRDIETVGSLTTAGYAYLPPAPADRDGIVVDVDFLRFSSRTLTHEVGHYLGLLHPFSGSCGVGGQNCAISGDRVCDTPPVQEANFGCNVGASSCSTDAPDLPDNITNFMDYSNCPRMFTEGQKTRVEGAIQAYRPLLVSPANLMVTGVADTNTTTVCAPIADFFTGSRVVCEGQTVRFLNYSYNGPVNTFTWHLPGADDTISHDPNPEVVYTTPGYHPVTLEVSNSAGSDTRTRNLFIRVLPAVSNFIAPAAETFEDDNLMGGEWIFESESEHFNWQRSRRAPASGSYSLFLDNGTMIESGNVHSFILPPVNFTEANAEEISFDVAYARRTDQSYDNLRVQVSTTCGQSWYTRFSKSGPLLTTVSGNVGGEFYPTAADYRTETISLSGFGDAENLLIAFRFMSRGGNDIYIDNIRIGNPETSIAESAGMQQLRLYPVPTQEQVHLEMTVPERGTLSFAVRDLLGQQLYQGQMPLQAGQQKLTFPLQELNIRKEGYYLLEGEINGTRFSRKLIYLKR